MTRLVSASLTALLLAAAGGIAVADPRAEEANKEANALMFADPPQVEEAIEKYKEAVQLSPEGRYYFNLCVAYYSAGDFGPALQACDAVAATGPDEALASKTAKTLAKVEDKIRALGRDPDELRRKDTSGGETGGGDTGSGGGDTGGGGGGDTGGGGGGGGGTGDGGGGGTGQPVNLADFRGEAPVSLFQTAPPSHKYVWTVGGYLLAGSSGYGGKNFGGAMSGARLFADYLIAPARRLGVQGYVGGMQVGTGSLDERLSVGEVGLAAYMHVLCKGRLCVTPLGGAHILVLQPESAESGFVSIGVRGEVGASLALGRKFEHVVSAQVGVTLSLPATGNEMADAADYGFDRGAGSMYVGLGYTHRFSTPFGQAPFITLE